MRCSQRRQDGPRREGCFRGACAQQGQLALGFPDRSRRLGQLTIADSRRRCHLRC